MTSAPPPGGLAARPAQRPTQPAERPARLDVGLVGSGRVGAALARALVRAGHRLVAVTPGHHAADLDAEIAPATQVAARAGLLLVAVPDDRLAAVAGELAAAGTLRRGALVAHTSGRFGLAVLEPLRAAGALVLALHPVMTFTGEPDELERLAGASFGVTAAPGLRAVGESLVLEMGADPVWVEDASRLRYHAALAHGANHLVTIVGQAAALLTEAGVAHPADMLAPLLAAALHNALRDGDGALTGPVVRGDGDTVAAHVTELAGSPVLDSYLVLAAATTERALADGRLDPAAARRLLDVLAGAVT